MNRKQDSWENKAFALIMGTALLGLFVVLERVDADQAEQMEHITLSNGMPCVIVRDQYGQTYGVSCDWDWEERE